MNKLIKEIEHKVRIVRNQLNNPSRGWEIWELSDALILLEKLKELTEDELSKPVKLPKFVIEIIEQTKKDRDPLSYCLDELHSTWLSNKEQEWVYESVDNEEKVAQAWLTGNYEEAKEQLLEKYVPTVKQLAERVKEEAE